MEPAQVTRPNDNCQTFFESIGVDPGTVIAGAAGRDGFYTIVLSEDSSRVLYTSGELAREFHEWPNGERDYIAFTAAALADWHNKNINPDLHNLIDPVL